VQFVAIPAWVGNGATIPSPLVDVVFGGSPEFSVVIPTQTYIDRQRDVQELPTVEFQCRIDLM
jgi:hypothetical protein